VGLRHLGGTAMTDKIAEIRARHARHELVGSSGSVIDTTGFSWTIPGLVAHDDRATLLAEVDRQRAEIERLLQAIGLVTTTVPDMEIDIENPVGMAQRVVAEVDRLRAKNERLRTVYVLIASRQSGPVDSATCWYEDKIIGCYISREAAEETAKLLMADWRINEYALVGNS